MIKIKKKKKVRLPRVPRDKKLLGPSFKDWEKLNGEAFHTLKHKAQSYYYNILDSKDLLEQTWKWMSSNGYTSKQIRTAKAARGQNSISDAVGLKCTLLNFGCPDFNEKENDYWSSLPGTANEITPISDFIRSKIKSAIDSGEQILKEVKQEEDKKKILPQYSIQDRIFQYAQGVAEELEDWLENFHRDPSTFKSDSFNVINFFDKKQINQAHARKIITFFEKQKDEFWMIVNMPKQKDLDLLDSATKDDMFQIIEGYSHLKKAEAHEFFKALENIIDACNLVIGKGKATRKTRVKKAPSKEKLISKLKYKVSDNELKVASINPIEIPDTTVLWVYNTKNKKLGCYVADSTSQVISVKGTSIVGYSKTESVQKTLRKPLEQLKEFMDNTKIGMRRNFDNIKTKSSSMSGRINNDTILLKSYR